MNKVSVGEPADGTLPYKGIFSEAHALAGSPPQAEPPCDLIDQYATIYWNSTCDALKALFLCTEANPPYNTHLC